MNFSRKKLKVKHKREQRRVEERYDDFTFPPKSSEGMGIGIGIVVGEKERKVS